MPVTHYHFGPGLAVKSLAPASFSFTVFAATEVVVDMETAFHLLNRSWPFHRTLHTLPGSLAVGLAVGGALYVFRGPATRAIAAVGRLLRMPAAWVDAETSSLGIVTGGVIGALSASLLDAIMHVDLMPFWPLSGVNPFLRVVELPVLHMLCFLVGLAGLLIMVGRVATNRQAG